ncbi:hypothetical protein HMPREF9120_01589 [Neisseria sp. oral taxon 020 str. F0370]|nr:hypothetical protein HMPREF9120_01589 [Neisseria sp. oral taxon 020 str. F0370]
MFVIRNGADCTAFIPMPSCYRPFCRQTVWGGRGKFDTMPCILHKLKVKASCVS